MRYSRTQIIASLIFTVLLFSASAAFAQYVPVGRVASQSGDIITIKGGSDVGFEDGDMLVVQREGVKVALIQVVKVHATSTEARVMNADFGYKIEKGDEVAPELLKTGRSRTVSVYTADEYWEYPNEYLPSFVELFQEKMPPMPRSDLDYEIERQKRVLEQQAHSREAMIRLADAYFRKDWFELAIYWYQRAIQEQPRAADSDKLMYQIVRAYGALGRPDKQKMYMDYLRVNYPSSVFTTFDTQLDIIEPTVQLLPEWQRHPPKRVHMRRGGMYTLEKAGMSPMGELAPGPIHGAPGKLVPMEQPAVPGRSAPSLKQPATEGGDQSMKETTEEPPASKKSKDKKETKKKKETKEKEKPEAAEESESSSEESCAAKVVAISGDAQVMPKDGDWGKAEMNQCLQTGDKVRTGEEGLMMVEYGGGGEDAQISLNAKTTATIGEWKKK